MDNRDILNEPVTVVVKRVVKSGKEGDFENWLKGATEDLKKFQGYRDITLIRPQSGSSKSEYVLVIRFDNYKNLDNWENSPIRNEWMNKAKGFTENLENQRITGLEYWFSLPEIPKANVPPRYKMAIVTIIAIYPLSTLIGIYLVPKLVWIEPYSRGLLVTILLVGLMTYVVMPYTTKLFRGWLFKGR
ncbi:MAG: hypothetical protein AB201_02910 [Parcubacteria bacterium C7867-006]|nr:MAG: hypothetical protein AB201_02910 [Parcubacteria bacterium C7867-006]